MQSNHSNPTESSLPKIVLANNKPYILDKIASQIEFAYTQSQSHTIDGNMYVSPPQQNIELDQNWNLSLDNIGDSYGTQYS